MEFVELIGFAAAFLTTISSVPQIIRSYRTKSTKDISFLWLATLLSGMALWFIYGIMLMSMPIIAANMVGICLILALILLKRKYG